MWDREQGLPPAARTGSRVVCDDGKSPCKCDCVSTKGPGLSAGTAHAAFLSPQRAMCCVSEAQAGRGVGAEFYYFLKKGPESTVSEPGLGGACWRSGPRPGMISLPLPRLCV